MRQSLSVISCTDPPCGACCTGQAALPISLVGKKDTFRMRGVKPLPDALRDELLALVDDYVSGRKPWPGDDTPCIWYDEDTKLCKHYEYRPILCRDAVVPGDDGCRRWRRLRGIDQRASYVVKGGRLTKKGG